jgi:excisionase family DNA binding protein
VRKGGAKKRVRREGGRDPDELLTPDTAARELHVSAETIRRLARTGAIAHLRIGRQIRIARRDLDTYLTRQGRKT